MKRNPLSALLGAALPLLLWADEPVQPDKNDACLTLNNRILGPRTADRPLPLLSGDPARGFRSACSVSWSALSPKNQALPVVGCFHGSLLQVANDSACGPGLGQLWVNSRWVVTSAELDQPQKRVATCQQLETGAWAGTREFSLDCEARKKELSPESLPQATTPSESAPPATSAPSKPDTSH